MIANKYYYFLFLVLVGCGSDSSDSVETPVSIEFSELVADVESAEQLFDGRAISLDGHFSFNNLPNICNVLPCVSVPDRDLMTDDDFTFSNEFLSRDSYDQCGGVYDQFFYGEGIQIRISNLPQLDYSLDCSGSFDVELSGLITYDYAYDYCSLTMHPSAQLELDEKSLFILSSEVDCYQ